MSAAPSVGTAAGTCFHCGLEVPPGFDCTVEILGAPRPVCCVGCAAVAELIVSSGLSDWYARRSAATGRPGELLPEVLERTEHLALPEIEEEFAVRQDSGGAEATLLVEGLTCAACVWVIERHLERLPGVDSVHVNLVSRRVHVAWDPEVHSLRDLVARLAEIGFSARPDRTDEAESLLREERRAALIRLGVSGLGTMNVMTYAVALYLGALDGMAPESRAFLRWLCLLVATPVVFVGARPFFEGAWRDLRVGRAGMDVPVALAIGGAYGISALAVLRGSGEIYLESACMFTFFLGLGRFLEAGVRQRAAASCRRMVSAVPATARRLVGASEKLVPARSLGVGDRFLVRPGEGLPADGRVVEGRSSLEEALLTGEPWPRSVEPGDEVIAGSLNAESPLVVEATRVGEDTSLAAIVRLVDRAQSERPELARRADRVASVFVTVVLGVALGAALYWGVSAPERAVGITLAVLVATCPCALGLATPAALTAATQGLATAGLLVTRGHVLDGLAEADRLVLDKTGTLTLGRPTLARVVALRGDDESRILALARALEARSEHPIARAFDAAGPQRVPDLRLVASEARSVPGSGVEGRFDGIVHRIGRPDWAAAIAPDGRVPAAPPGTGAQAWVLLADERGARAWLGLDDPLRPEAAAAVARLAALGMPLELLSGDPSAAPTRIARELGLEVVCPAATPDAKVARIRDLQAAGQRVVAVGDGVNDGPVMRAADVSIAMGSGSDLTRISADAVLVRDDLSRLPGAIERARRTRRVIAQNFAWAIAYNACALPLALTGWLAPWLAAAGMSLSSLVVVLNALRLARPEVD